MYPTTHFSQHCLVKSRAITLGAMCRFKIPSDIHHLVWYSISIEMFYQSEIATKTSYGPCMQVFELSTMKKQKKAFARNEASRGLH